jgi:transcriptional regulator with GAF, ATPase, and Fis domain
MPSVWCRFFNGETLLSKSIVRQALGKAGLALQDFDHDTAGGAGLLFFNEVTQALCNLLREVSHHGLERVLAIAVSHSVLSSNNAWRLCQAGASDVLAWDRLADPGSEIKARLERWDAIDRVVNSPLVQNNLVGKSPVWISILRQIVEVAQFTDASVLITGETGTGKELVARLIHTLDSRAGKRDLVVLDCTTVVPELSGSEFFGHERGAFTGALTQRDGAFALAHGGTLFLDEVGDLALGLQAQLLRVVQEGTYKRVGGNAWQNTSFRLICATNKDFTRELTDGKFRHDFYYRIAGWSYRLPSLRERSEDILPLTRHFMQQLRSQEEPPTLDEPVREYLLKREYPGNVRDLKRLVSRIRYRHVGQGPVTVGDIPEEERPSVESGPADWRDVSFENSIQRALLMGAGLKEIGRVAEDIAIQIALHNENGNLRRAARKLYVTERALQLRRALRRRIPERDA